MSGGANQRMRRVNSLLRQVLAERVEEMKDPRLVLVTITAVETAPDLRHAVAFFSTLDPAGIEDARAALAAAAPRLRRLLGAEVRLKYVPALEFVPDRGVYAGERIDSILRRLADEEESP